MKVKFKKLVPGAVLPKKATEGSAAYDLYVTEDIIIEPGRHIIPLGFAMEMEPGHQAQVEPRSGFSSKGMEGYHVMEHNIGCNTSFRPYSVLNDIVMKYENTSLKKSRYVSMDPDRFDCDVIVGKIDSDYRDGCGVILHNRDMRTFMIKTGTRIAQLTFLKVEEVDWEETDTLSETDREGGFGSTGTK